MSFRKGGNLKKIETFQKKILIDKMYIEINELFK